MVHAINAAFGGSILWAVGFLINPLQSARLIALTTRMAWPNILIRGEGGGAYHLKGSPDLDRRI